MFFSREGPNDRKSQVQIGRKVGVLKAEYQGNEGFYQGNEGFLQRDSVEHKGYAEARSTDCREGKERDGASDLLEAVEEAQNEGGQFEKAGYPG